MVEYKLTTTKKDVMEFSSSDRLYRDLAIAIRERYVVLYKRKDGTQHDRLLYTRTNSTYTMIEEHVRALPAELYSIFVCVDFDEAYKLTDDEHCVHI